MRVKLFLKLTSFSILLSLLAPFYFAEPIFLAGDSSYRHIYTYFDFVPDTVIHLANGTLGNEALGIVPLLYLFSLLSATNYLQILAKALVIFLVLKLSQVERLRTKKVVVISLIILIIFQIAGIFARKIIIDTPAEYQLVRDGFIQQLHTGMTQDQVITLKEKTIPNYVTKESYGWPFDDGLSPPGPIPESYGYCTKHFPRKDSYYSWIETCYSQDDILVEFHDHL